MTKVTYMIYLLLAMSWSKNLDEAGKRNTVPGHTPYKEEVLDDDCNYGETKCEFDQEINTNSADVTCAYSSNLRLDIFGNESSRKTIDTSSGCCCHKVNNFDVCPDDLKSHITDTDTYCYELNRNQKFSTTCKYPHSLEYSELPEFFQNKSEDHKIWLNIFRESKTGYPNFVYHENGKMYGLPFYAINENENILSHDCIMIWKTNLVRVDCNALDISTLCVYSYEKLQSKKLISLCNSLDDGHYDDCMVSDFDLSQPKCFCKKVDAIQPKKQQFCSKLAEPTHVYQNIFLKSFLDNGNKRCWMGMSKKQNSKSETYYEWSTTNKRVGYTDWSQPYNYCQHSEGAFKFENFPYGGWKLDQDRSLDCALCEVALDLKKPSLTLRFSRSKNRIELTVKNIDSISDRNEEDIYCFSDSNEEEFTHRVNITFSRSVNTKTEYLLDVSEIPSHFWCRAFEFSSDKVVNSNKIFARSNSHRSSNEFVIIVRHNLKRPSTIDPFVRTFHFTICRRIKEIIIDSITNCDILSLRPISGSYGFGNKSITVNCHLTIYCTSGSIQQQYDKLNEILLEEEKNPSNYTRRNFRSTEVCLKDTTPSADNQTLVWPTTALGATAIPINVLCLDKTRGMLPVTRKCTGNFLNGANWNEPVGKCYNDTEYSETTNELFDFAHGDVSTQEITHGLLKITEKCISDEPINVHLATSALERVTVTEGEKIHEDNFSAIFNNMMNFDNETLKVAQTCLNSTDRLLSLLDNFIVHNIKRPWIKILPRLVIQISNLRESTVRGLAMHNVISENTNFQLYKISQLHQDTSFENIIKDKKLDIAVLFPSEEVNKIKEEFAKDTAIMLVIVVFYDDILFRETNNKSVQQSKSKVVGVTVPGYQKLSKPLKIALRTVEKYENQKNCSFWNYGLNSEMVRMYGQWETSVESKTEMLEICEFDHMTHFGLLIQGDLVKSPHDLALNILTGLGSSLSLIGIIPIFLTAITFKSWRSKAGNVILINFCISITLQISLIFSLYAIKQDGIACKAVAASLHYIIVSEFCWMFVVAILQYRRFVTVFTPQESYIVVKCLIAGWIVPLLPVVVTLLTSIQSYRINAHNFCYISGKYMIYAYICPILFILLCNAVVFLKIIYCLARQTSSCVQKSKNYKLQILLALFLFFVLGITWVFGFLGALTNAIWLTYVFCVTATLRGIVLFLFFIAGNEETSLMWQKRTTYYVDSRKQSKPSTSDTAISND